MISVNDKIEDKTEIIFDNLEIAFKDKSDTDLRNSYKLFLFINNPFLLKIGKPFLQAAMKIRLPIEGLVKISIFKHFCGGETIQESLAAVRKLKNSNISTILDYSIEGKESDTDFDQTKEMILAVIKAAKKDPALPFFSVFKPTGMARLSLLEKLNDVNRKNELTNDEAEEFARVEKRFYDICKSAYEYDVPVYIDAEETWIQDVIDTLVTKMMLQFNKEKVIVYNTVQMYRTHRLEAVQKALLHARENGYKLGIKLVRGAYMEKERERAKKMGYTSPIQLDKKNTDSDFNKVLQFCVDNIEHISLCAGTHNEESSAFLANAMQAANLKRNDERIWFSQLYGMSDHISYNLAAAGYNVAKYLPFGPVKGVLPYLIRRAEENTSISGQMGREMSMLVKEIKRRQLKSKP